MTVWVFLLTPQPLDALSILLCSTHSELHHQKRAGSCHCTNSYWSWVKRDKHIDSCHALFVSLICAQFVLPLTWTYSITLANAGELSHSTEWLHSVECTVRTLSCSRNVQDLAVTIIFRSYIGTYVFTWIILRIILVYYNLDPRLDYWLGKVVNSPRAPDPRRVWFVVINFVCKYVPL